MNCWSVSAPVCGSDGARQLLHSLQEIVALQFLMRLRVARYVKDATQDLQAGDNDSTLAAITARSDKALRRTLSSGARDFLTAFSEPPWEAAHTTSCGNCRNFDSRKVLPVIVSSNRRKVQAQIGDVGRGARGRKQWRETEKRVSM